MHNILGPPGRFNDFWFIEALIYMMLAMLALLAIPSVDRTERRYPFALPMVLMTLSLVTRYQLFPGVKLGTPLAAFWLFALGWSAAKATTGGSGCWCRSRAWRPSSDSTAIWRGRR